MFDECHKAKNLCPVGSSKPTKTGLAVLELQNKLPKARVIYASATGKDDFHHLNIEWIAMPVFKVGGEKP